MRPWLTLSGLCLVLVLGAPARAETIKLYNSAAGTLYLDGDEIGKVKPHTDASMEIPGVDPGKHRLRLVAQDKTETSRSFQVQAGKAKTVRFLVDEDASGDQAAPAAQSQDQGQADDEDEGAPGASLPITKGNVTGGPCGCDFSPVSKAEDIGDLRRLWGKEQYNSEATAGQYIAYIWNNSAISVTTFRDSGRLTMITISGQEMMQPFSYGGGAHIYSAIKLGMYLDEFKRIYPAFSALNNTHLAGMDRQVFLGQCGGGSFTYQFSMKTSKLIGITYTYPQPQ